MRAFYTYACLTFLVAGLITFAATGDFLLLLIIAGGCPINALVVLFWIRLFYHMADRYGWNA